MDSPQARSVLDSKKGPLLYAEGALGRSAKQQTEASLPPPPLHPPFTASPYVLMARPGFFLPAKGLEPAKQYMKDYWEQQQKHMEQRLGRGPPGPYSAALGPHEVSGTHEAGGRQGAEGPLASLWPHEGATSSQVPPGWPPRGPPEGPPGATPEMPSSGAAPQGPPGGPPEGLPVDIPDYPLHADDYRAQLHHQLAVNAA